MKNREVTTPLFKAAVVNPQDGLADTPLGFLTITTGNNIGQVFAIYPGKIVIGRDDDCDIVLDDKQISRQHAKLDADPSQLVLRDLKTTNGTFVAGKAIESMVLQHGDMISMGLTTLQFMTVRPPHWLPGLDYVHSHDDFMHRLTEEIDRAQRYARPLSLIMLNCTATAADSGAIKRQELVSKIRPLLRPMDLIASYSEDDLELLLPEMDAAEADVLGAALQKAVQPQIRLKVGRTTYPFDGNSREILLERARKNLRASSATTAQPEASVILDEKMVLHSSKMRSLYQTIVRLAASPIAVLIQGETGTGKELVAEAIHRHSERRDKPFLAINCGAFTASLLESELFGHEKGSFTGADQRKIGLIEAAAAGTIFLDEIGEMPLQLQVKLLRVLQEGTLRRVGGNETIKVDFRVVSATNRDLKKMVEAGNFREDLYYRLNAIVLEVPPLRERADEIPYLANFFLEQYKQHYHKAALQLAPASLQLLSQQSWPGNIRELKNCIERAVVITPGNAILPEHLNLPTTYIPTLQPAAAITHEPAVTGQMRPLLDNYERQLLLKALDETNWNQTQAAKLLKIPRRTLVSKLKKHQIHKP